MSCSRLHSKKYFEVPRVLLLCSLRCQKGCYVFDSSLFTRSSAQTHTNQLPDLSPRRRMKRILSLCSHLIESVPCLALRALLSSVRRLLVAPAPGRPLFDTGRIRHSVVTPSRSSVISCCPCFSCTSLNRSLFGRTDLERMQRWRHNHAFWVLHRPLHL
jgi:hypothetical protein